MPYEEMSDYWDNLNKYQRRFKDAMGREQAFANQVAAGVQSGQTSVAQRQMQAGLAGTQQAIAQQASAGGANPLAARSAAYAGGQAGTDVTRASSALRAQEMQAAQQMQMGALARESEGVLQQQQMDMATTQAALAERRMREEGEWNKTKDIMGIASFGLLSDRKAKNWNYSDRTMKDYVPVQYDVRPTMFGAGKSLAAAGEAAAVGIPTQVVETDRGPAVIEAAPGTSTRGLRPRAMGDYVFVQQPVVPVAPQGAAIRGGAAAGTPAVVITPAGGRYGPGMPVPQPYGPKQTAGQVGGKVVQKNPKGEAPTKGAQFRGEFTEEEAAREWDNPENPFQKQLSANERASRPGPTSERDLQRIREGKPTEEEENELHRLQYLAGQRGDVVVPRDAFGPIYQEAEIVPGNKILEYTGYSWQPGATTLESRGFDYETMADKIRKSEEAFMRLYPFGYQQAEGSPM